MNIFILVAVLTLIYLGVLYYFMEKSRKATEKELIEEIEKYKSHKNTNWDDLMLQVENIESIKDQRYGRFIVTIKEDICLIESTRKSKSSYTAFKSEKGSKYDVVSATVQDFLNWYNNIK